MARRAEPEPERCKTCRFWLATEGKEEGECRRFPPILAVLPMNLPAKLITPASHWCGEYERVRES